MNLRYLIIINVLNLVISFINSSIIPSGSSSPQFNKNTNIINKNCQQNVANIRQHSATNYAVAVSLLESDNSTVKGKNASTNSKNENINGNISYSETIVKTIYDLSTSVKQFGQNFIYFIGDFALDIQELLKNAVGKIKSVIIILGEKILEDHSDSVKSLLIGIKDQLIEVESLFKEFMILSNNEFIRVMEHVNGTLMGLSHEMEIWANEIKYKLKNVKNEKVYSRGCKVVDKFINNSMKEMKNCCNIAIKPWISLCRSLKDIFGDILILTIDAVDKIDSCMVENRGSDGFVLCMKQIYERIFELMAEAKELKRRLIDNMPIKIMYSSCCIAVTTVSVEVKKSHLERKLQSDYYIK